MIRKTLYLVVFVFFIATNANAGPWVTCDPQTGVEYYQVYNHGVLIEGSDNVPPTPDGTVLWDLAGADPAELSITLKACNVRGCSPESDPLALPSLLSKPENTRVTE